MRFPDNRPRRSLIPLLLLGIIVLLVTITAENELPKTWKMPGVQPVPEGNSEANPDTIPDGNPGANPQATPEVNPKARPKSQSKESDDVTAYFPIYLGLAYDFAGAGNEYAPFTRRVLFAENNHVQIQEDTGGTVMALVYSVTPQEVALVFREGEFYEERSVLEELPQEPETLDVLLKAPIRVGTRWEHEGRKREIVAILDEYTVPMGTFTDVVKVQIQYPDTPDAVSHEYYAKNIGLISRIYENKEGDFKVTSSLQGFGLDQRR